MAAGFKFTPSNRNTLATDYDVVIIGSGGAGLTTAIQAYELGLKPVILEKMSKIGGNTTRASSGMNAAETLIQLNHQVVDSYADFYKETFAGGGQQNNVDLLKYFTEHSALAINWLVAHNIHLDDLTITGGMSQMRTHRPASQAAIGGFLVTELLKQVALANIPLFTDALVNALKTDEAGTVTGVQATVDGREVLVGSKAVVLATGGFAAGKELLAKYRPDLLNRNTTNHPGATGDGIKLATAVGARLVAMDQIQVHPTVQQENDHAFLIGEAVRGEGAILVNREGRRFVNELATRKKVTEEIDNLGGTGAYLIFDQAVVDRVKAIEFYKSMGLVKTGATLEELAKVVGLDASNLMATTTTWNAAVANQQDEAYHRTTGMARGLTHGPFYAIHIAPAIHYTMGGVAIDYKTHVLNEDQQPIKGLYAAGEVVGGLHGNNRIGGNSIAETVVFGRQAGQQVFKDCRTD